MIEEKIKKSCDQILPTEHEKQQMLDRILCTKRKRGFRKLCLIGAILTTTATTIFVITISHQMPVQPSNTPMIRLMNLNQIEYKGECYEYVGLHSGEKLKRTNEQIMGGIVYQIKGQKNAIVVYQNGEYQHYQKCEGE